MPIAASSNTSRNRSRCSSSTCWSSRRPVAPAPVAAGRRLVDGARDEQRPARAARGGWTSRGRPRRRGPSACSGSPCSSKPLYRTTRVSGDTSRIRGSASSPSMTGIDTSRSISGGLQLARPAATASAPLPASPTTVSTPDSSQPGPHQRAHLRGVVDDDDGRGRRTWIRRYPLAPDPVAGSCDLIAAVNPRTTGRI